MLKNTGKSKSNREKSNSNGTHFSYDDYRKKVKKTSYKDFIVFLSVLIIGILIFLGFAKILSPNVDVEIADKEEYSDIEDDNAQQGLIDERLKHLQAEDDAKEEESPKEDSLFAPELDEAIILPAQIKKTIGEMEDEMLNDKNKKEKAEAPKNENNTETKPSAHTETAAPAPTAVSSIYRVVVGSYATEKQAEVAKSIMSDAGLGVTPIIKNIGGTYTLQIGVFSTKEKAQQSVNNLLKNNFPARISE